MAKSQIKIEKDGDIFIIAKDKNYELFFSMSVVFYQKVIEIMKQDSGLNISINPKFESVLLKMSLNNESIKINQDDLKLLLDWVDCLCLIMLDIESIDYKNKDIKKYLRLSESLISNSKKIINS